MSMLSFKLAQGVCNKLEEVYKDKEVTFDFYPTEKKQIVYYRSPLFKGCMKKLGCIDEVTHNFHLSSDKDNNRMLKCVAVQYIENAEENVDKIVDTIRKVKFPPMTLHINNLNDETNK